MIIIFIILYLNKLKSFRAIFERNPEELRKWMKNILILYSRRERRGSIANTLKTKVKIRIKKIKLKFFKMEDPSMRIITLKNPKEPKE